MPLGGPVYHFKDIQQHNRLFLIDGPVVNNVNNNNEKVVNNWKYTHISKFKIRICFNAAF